MVSAQIGSLSAAPCRDGNMPYSALGLWVGVMAFQAYVAELTCGGSTERVHADGWDLLVGVLA